MSNFDTFRREGFLRNEIIYACITAKANTTASVSLKIYDKNTHQELPEHRLRQLITQPNPLMSETDFWQTIIIHLDLAGVSYWEKVRDNGGNVIELWPLRPDYIQAIRGNQTYIQAYRYIPPGVEPATIAAEDVFVVPRYDPAYLDRYISPVAVAARTADVDNSLTDYLKLFFEHGGTPPTILTSKLKLDPSDITRIRNQLQERYGGSQNWITPMVLDSDTTMQKIGFDFKEMGVELLDGRDETRICAVLEVPPIIISTAFGMSRSTFSNYGEARRAWWEDKLTPLYKKLADRVNMDLVKDIGEAVYVKWDFSQVPAFQEEQNSRWTRATAALTAGGITRNQFLHEVGKPDIGPAGDVFLQSNMVTPVSATEVITDTDVTPEESPTPEKKPKTGDQPATEEKPTNDKKPTPPEQKAGNPVRPHGNPLATEQATKVDPFTDEEIKQLFEAYASLPALNKLDKLRKVS